MTDLIMLFGMINDSSKMKLSVDLIVKPDILIRQTREKVANQLPTQTQVVRPLN